MIRVGDVMRGKKSGALYVVTAMSGPRNGSAKVLEGAGRVVQGQDIIFFSRYWTVTLVGRNYKAK